MVRAPTARPCRRKWSSRSSIVFQSADIASNVRDATAERVGRTRCPYQPVAILRRKSNEPGTMASDAFSSARIQAQGVEQMAIEISTGHRAPVTARRMAEAAQRYLDSLDAPRRKATTFAFED